MSPRARKRLWRLALIAACLVAAWRLAALRERPIEPLARHGALLADRSVPAERARVARVIDGDTVRLGDGRTVRYVGIDSPERGQPLHRFATRLNRQLTLGKSVGLLYDQVRRDRHGRLLCYVIDERTGVVINGEMIRYGAAHVYTIPPNTLYHRRFTSLQRAARRARRGLWAHLTEGDESFYIASRRGYRFHRPSCKAVDSISAADRVELSSRAEAFDRGLSPCRKCRP